MSIESSLYARLTAHAGVSALVGTRIYPLLMPQTPVLPAITYQRISAEHIASIGGHSGLENPRIQIDIWALSYNTSKALAAQVRAALTESMDGFAALLLTDLDDYEPETRIYRCSLDFSLWAEE